MSLSSKNIENILASFYGKFGETFRQAIPVFSFRLKLFIIRYSPDDALANQVIDGLTDEENATIDRVAGAIGLSRDLLRSPRGSEIFESLIKEEREAKNSQAP